ncbi:hypothetical protein CANARDRAFT_199183 [[Candida] arabinofermentans NRRL YB-2248]|uniref:Uncharacterized protein n=1 Tax=[Candida] arabinofermentans NRRL YB-2248 TaxID=983967 RepID=A0A1E4T0M2_9ASCO|nr:hypothetical protein CANARDRAFT_199183 [[Candida] arabinofermentans NRRL YB-2248]
MSVTSTHVDASIHSSISGDSILDDHRHQRMTLPVKTDSRLQQDGSSHNATHQATIEEEEYMTHKQFFSKKPEALLNSSDLRDKMVATEDDDDHGSEYGIPIPSMLNSITNPASATLASPTSVPRRSRARSRSFSEQVKLFIRPKDEPAPGGILMSGSTATNNGSSNNNNTGNNNTGVTISGNALTRTISKSSTKSDYSRRRVNSNAAKDTNDSDSDVDSHASRDSQETEDDVCFPILPEHVRVKGIDFAEIEEFIQEQREENEIILKREEELRYKYDVSRTTSSQKYSSAALKYTPKSELHLETGGTDDSTSTGEKASIYFSSEDDNNVTFEKPELMDKGSAPPDRFSFFSSENEETIHAPDIPSLVKPGEPFQNLFQDDEATWWLDCICPTDNEMKMLAKAFGIHPLTAEDIRMQETREKVELFKSYYFVCFHTFETDSESEDFLEPINVYIVVFRNGILTFHFCPIAHPANVRRRVRQLRDYVNVSADWLCYAMIDDITDGFAPVIHAIEYEADAIEDSVFLSTENDFGAMLLRIGQARRKVMTLMRLLQGKADVIKMFAKRCQDEASRPSYASNTNLQSQMYNSAQPRADIALYLGDIQDHIITMFQSLLSYEKIFSRSHANYLAQLQVQSFYSSNKATEMLSKVTIIGTILVPLNVVTGLFGMNVHVPGQGTETFAWFGGILGFIAVIIFVSLVMARRYLNRIHKDPSGYNTSTGISIKSFRFGRKNREDTRGRSDRSMASLPTKFTRYGGEW